MRDDVGILNRTPAIEHLPTQSPSLANDGPLPGFTAVNNGTSHRSTSFRPDGPGPRPITLPPVEHRAIEAAAMTSSNQSHGWRPTQPPTPAEDESGRPSTEESSANKRKRADSPAEAHRGDVQRDQQSGRDGSQTPKRRIINGTAEPDHAPAPRRNREGHEDLEEATAAVRERTPETRAGHRAPLGDPPPEVAAVLRAEVQEFTDETQARPSDGSPHEGDPGQSHAFPYGTNKAPGSEDKAKRKRNFSNRTKTGCHTCRYRKKKCDEGRPSCNNCVRGGFGCGGYGPKPTGGSKPMPGRNVQAALQSKPNEMYPPANGQPYGYDRMIYREGPPPPMQAGAERYPLPQTKMMDHQPPRYAAHHVPIDPRPPIGPEVWPHRPHSQYSDRRELPPAPLYAPSDPPLPPPPAPSYNGSHPPPPPPPYRGYPAPPPPPPPPEPWQAHNPHIYPTHPPSGPPTVISSRASAISSSSGSHGGGLPPYLQNLAAPASARTKMLRGERYAHFDDPALRSERISCRKAVEAYNESCRALKPSSDPEQERNFLAIYEPRERAWEMGKHWDGLKGSVGSHTLVETPFNCEFGYNIHLGKEVLIQQNCTMQDASIIYIGDRTIIGPNVKFYCLTTSVDAQQRRGCRGEFQAGPIRVEEDVVIHADCTILPFRTIGKGAVVGAGSVVTRDVKPYTVVAGNPAKLIRKRKIEPGPSADRHCDEIQEQNEAMLKKLLDNEVIPRDD